MSTLNSQRDPPKLFGYTQNGRIHYNFPTFSVNVLCLTLLCSMAMMRVLLFIIDDGNFCGDPMNDEDQDGIMNTSF